LKRKYLIISPGQQTENKAEKRLPVEENDGESPKQICGRLMEFIVRLPGEKC